ncbi:golgin subfamily A member 6-like protein 6 [Bombus huntii]|uniref:golgin subfamily A member 6-like protein 6 n=1 Tax=Bombus huntii TaxID=85661 RepID=UPI0021A9CA83|nr:golgin subfamily A member 6-like protein 6 [Bombus huntii]XP_050494321.1 golgin subfamily A member 6-like protein 6 [Bombus huntii]XP_050494479.1 golgin subfamily A member 6-like protein 6 [Bombus huntii]
MKVGKRVESDHMPLEIETEGPEVQRDEERKGEERERREWTKESAGRYLEECKDWASRGRTVEEMWAEIKKKINEAIPKKRVRIRKWSIGEKVWYDKEWKERKREIRRKMTKFRKGKCSREEFIEEKKEFKQWCEQRKEKQEEEEMEKLKKIKTEQEAWKYINKYRRRREVVDEAIREEEWKNHFMEALEGTENKEDKRTEGWREEEESKEEREDNIEKEEVILQIRKLKEKKATREDGLENEVWKYAPKEVGEALWEMLGKIWNGKGISEGWRKCVICPIYKRRNKGAVKSYRGVTLMDTAYKIYAGILDERLKVEIEDKVVESQFGFRKGREVIDVVYVLNHIIDKQLSGERGKLYACFVDLKSAFDRVNRKKLGEIMRRMGVNEKLTRRIEEIYEETKNVVRIRNNNTEEFWTVRGVGQGCPLSPALFNIYVAGLEEIRK